MHKFFLPVIATLSSLIGVGARASLPAGGPPFGFDTYPVHQIYVGAPAPLEYKSERQKSFSEMLNAQTLGPANFSGHYRIAHLSCGEGCHQIAIIDLPTGEVHIPNFVFANVAAGELGPKRCMEYRADSELLILHGTINTPGAVTPAKLGTHYFHWNGAKLVPLANAN